MDWGLGHFAAPGYPSLDDITLSTPLLEPPPQHLSVPSFPPFLRQRRAFSNWFYYWALITNVVMRCTWSLSISMFVLPPSTSLLLALLEILRRGQWMILRIEHEYNTLTMEKQSPLSDPADPDAPIAYSGGDLLSPSRSRLAAIMSSVPSIRYTHRDYDDEIHTDDKGHPGLTPLDLVRSSFRESPQSWQDPREGHRRQAQSKPKPASIRGATEADLETYFFHGLRAEDSRAPLPLKKGICKTF
jgi:hypothetical protein